MEFLKEILGEDLFSQVEEKANAYNGNEENKESAMLDRLNKLDERDNLFAASIRSMLRQDIINAYDKYTAKGYAPVYVKDNVREMYECYHALGGNGTITHLVEEFMNLPTKE